jgi:hypothetical protein
MRGWVEPRTRPCPCGSGKDSHWLKDARGIEVARVCETCEAGKKAGYRPDIFTDSQYWADEPIDGD